MLHSSVILCEPFFIGIVVAWKMASFKTKSVISSSNLRLRRLVCTTATKNPGSARTGENIFTLPAVARSIKVIDYNIPYAWYPVNARNNLLVFSEDGGVRTLATLTPGVYTVAQMITEIQTRMNAVSDNGRTYTVAVNGNTGIMTITASVGDFTIHFSLT